ncbi:hypothetical protein [Stieleria mannarensis]|uniref:hypothetical protein n=1 Tax=Stieleria mannarensis TaxID=2755585 RepID=UPI001C722000|nr:hypothetical protein [Rhodopirellula sp. JC639]
MLLALVTVAIRSDAGVITNGTFDDATDLAGFTVVGEDFFFAPISAGTVSEPGGSFAQLQNDNATFLLQLQQEFTVPSVASTLSFDFAFSTEGSPSTVGPVIDAFSVNLKSRSGLDDLLDILVVDAVVGVKIDPADGSEIPPKRAIDVSLESVAFDPGFSGFTGGTDFFGRVSVDLPSEVLGDEVTLSFNLIDVDGPGGFGLPDPFATIAAVDNITLTSSSSVIPEPASVATWSLMLLGTTLRRRRR